MNKEQVLRKRIEELEEEIEGHSHHVSMSDTVFDLRVELEDVEIELEELLAKSYPLLPTG